MDPYEYQRMRNLEGQFWWYVALRRRLLRDSARILRDHSSPLILDAGCGTGANAAALSALGDVHAFDLSSEAISGTRDRKILNLSRAALGHIPYATGVFDLAVSMDVLYHAWVSDDQLALRELHRVLKPGGRLIVQVAALEALRGSHDVVVMTARRYQRSTLSSQLRNAGFRVDTITYRNGLLLPLIFLKRFMQGSHSSQTDLQMPPPWINFTLQKVLEYEDRLTTRVPLPLGVSLYAVAQKV